MFIIRKEFKFEAGHRLSLNTSKCWNIHGHNYKVIVEVQCEDLDEKGMIIDFGILKQIVSPVLLRFDHSLILNENDTLSIPQEYNVVWFHGEPTAENFAKVFYDRIKSELVCYLNLKNQSSLDSLKLKSVTVFETDGSSAIYHE